MRAWLIGAALVFGAIAVCLFPLWPRSVRNYVYYLSIAAAAFLFFIIGLAVCEYNKYESIVFVFVIFINCHYCPFLVRLIIFTIVWVFTFGKHHFWLLPNLTEDVGFRESFWPLYKHDLKNNDSKEDKKKKRKDSDNSITHIEEDKSLVDTKESGSESASTVESIAKTNSSVESKDNKDGNNGFEILDSNEIEEEEELKEGYYLKDIRK